MDIEILRNWLMDCPYITAPVTVEYLEATPDAVGVFSKGVRELSRRQDVMGNIWVTCQSRFSLLRRAPRFNNDGELAQWLQDLQAWFPKQSFFHMWLTNVRVEACDGCLQEDTADAMAVYAVTLNVEYVQTCLAN